MGRLESTITVITNAIVLADARDQSPNGLVLIPSLQKARLLVPQACREELSETALGSFPMSISPHPFLSLGSCKRETMLRVDAYACFARFMCRIEYSAMILDIVNRVQGALVRFRQRRTRRRFCTLSGYGRPIFKGVSKT